MAVQCAGTLWFAKPDALKVIIVLLLIIQPLEGISN